ncbi:MAG: Eco57I restriction-modification methylase domain-containing protein [Chloroflexi bacterium]|nr:Eco57I restriction-modification methylase domain-containing protein [Chloroflexota bacterium]
MPDKASIAEQRAVEAHLRQLKSLDDLRRLLADLNYGVGDEPVSVADWKSELVETAKNGHLRTVARHEDFVITHCRLQELRVGPEREIVTRLVRQYDRGLFAFSNFEGSHWHLVNVKRDSRQHNRLVLRRIAVSPEEQLRTAIERISLLKIDDPYEPGLEVELKHENAFDVEKVTEEFFRQYAQVFEYVEEQIQGFKEGETKRLFAQRLFNRLMFIAFIQKKGWLRLDSQRSYLTALWEAYAHENSSKTNFYRDRLKLLFFSGLNTPSEVNIIGINRGGFLKTVIGDVPYLNGGLFEEDEDDRKTEIVVPDQCFEIILDNLFNRFNFTVTESTPLDIEVAVDPEMLGKVFEELVTGRHETGSYYTPKPVVSFMCREALNGYLETSLPGETSAAIGKFVEDHEPVGLQNPEAVLEALRRVKVCDPACGSGAYLLGMLHELLDLRTCLFATSNLDPISSYQRKLEIIQNNLYGVDLDLFAVNIGRLRLWLSLAVEFEGMNPPPLPNLDFKIETGDSLAAPDPSTGMQGSFRQQQIEDYFSLKASYMTAHGGEKLTLREQIAMLKAQIATWSHGGKQVVGFDWPVEFAEVFTDGGFDIVLANPPYVRADAQFRHLENEDERQAAIAKWKDYRAGLLKSGIYQTLYEKWDMFLPFLERAYQLLRTNGRMVFIISDAYNAAKYAQKSHEFFLNNACINRIDFCTDIPLFEAGINNTIVHFSKAVPDATHQPIRVRRWGEAGENFDQNTEVLPSAIQNQFGTAMFRSKSTSVKLPHYTNYPELSKVCYISKGMVVHANERICRGAFKCAALISPVQDRLHPKPFVLGRDLMRWVTGNVRYLEWGTKRAPSQFSRPTFPELYEVPEKLISLDVAGNTQRVIYDNQQLFHNHTADSLVPWHYLRGVRNKSIQKTAKYRDEVKTTEVTPKILREDLEKLSVQFAPKYLLAIMNSTFARNWLRSQQRHRIHFYPNDWKLLPLAPATAEQQAAIVALVDEILALHSKHGYPLPPQSQLRLQELEKQIDKIVAELYKLQNG